MSVDKQALKAELVGLLEQERDTLVAAQRATSEGVVHDDARPENDKDTRATEASYLARGQAKRVRELSADTERVRAMLLKGYLDGDAIGLGAVIAIADGDGNPKGTLFLAPAGGGMTLTSTGAPVRVTTPQSPLGKALVRARAGDFVEVARAGGIEEIEVLTVS